MKGVVFRSFEIFASKKYGDDIVDQAMDQPELSTGGAFTSIGEYPHTDLMMIATAVANETSTPLNTLVRDFGEALFHILAGAHKDMVDDFDGPIALLSVIESVIHRDVRKLYSNAELPRFDILERHDDKYVYMEYSSARPFADLAEGLIWGCLDHYSAREHSTVYREDLANDGTHTRFEVSVLQYDQRP